MKQYLVTKELGSPCVELDEMKTYMSVDHDEHDEVILSLIRGADRDVAEYLWHTLTESRYRLYIDAIPADGIIPLWRGPILNAEAIETISFYDSDNVVNELDPSDFYVSGIGIEPALITYTGGAITTFNRRDAIFIDYIAGYGNSANDVPEEYRVAIRRLVHYWYDTPMDTTRRFPSDVIRYLGKYRRMRFDHPEPLM